MHLFYICLELMFAKIGFGLQMNHLIKFKFFLIGNISNLIDIDIQLVLKVLSIFVYQDAI